MKTLLCILGLVVIVAAGTLLLNAGPSPQPAIVPGMTAAVAAGQTPPDSYYFPGAERVRELEGKPAPSLHLDRWIGENVSLDDWKGKVVVIDFWGTWCPPCRKALPKNSTLYKKYHDQGLEILGIHSTNGAEKMPGFVADMNIKYPLAADVDNQTARAWGVPFWPTYIVIDREGIVRAAGLRPDKVDHVVRKFLRDDSKSDTSGSATDAGEDSARQNESGEGDSAPATENGVPVAWLENPQARGRLVSLMKQPSPPAIAGTEWLNSDALNLADLKGSVVVLDFWGTWCPPCIASIPKNNRLHETYKDDGLVFIGICHPRNVHRMSQVAERYNIAYPTCADVDGEIIDAYAVDGFPDYYLIDRQGRLRIADCNNNDIEEAIKFLLAE